MKPVTKKVIITVSVPLVIITLFLLKKYILALADFMPVCKIHAATGLWCPGCGNTRAVKAMLSFHFIDAFRYNAFTPLLSIAALLLYLQYIISAWIKPIKLLPRSFVFYSILGGLWVVYCVVRNFINFMP